MVLIAASLMLRLLRGSVLLIPAVERLDLLSLPQSIASGFDKRVDRCEHNLSY